MNDYYFVLLMFVITGLALLMFFITGADEVELVADSSAMLMPIAATTTNMQTATIANVFFIIFYLLSQYRMPTLV
jgi:hypothetical protein